MSALSEAIRNIKAMLYDRVSSPFFQTFFLVITYHYWPIIFIATDSRLTSDQKIDNINIILGTEGSPGVFELFFTTLAANFLIAGFSVIAYFAKGVAEGINKRIRNKFNPDYVNSAKYTEALSSLSDNVTYLTESNSSKDQKISMLTLIASLSDREKLILQKANANGGRYYFSKHREGDDELCKAMHERGILGRSNNHWAVSNKELLAYIDIHFNGRFFDTPDNNPKCQVP
ncbi:hypothetical protein L0E83_09980 [Marichromatium gracile]|uniref:hypothetical protein n=1 Tax=Marichromatium gracile TaxID=1048 RepID=UPI001F3D95C0|nr:hypothetical protein [Marichromatium gracile]MCF1183759.1 hypothetical protein [Marichromatium gracile]